MTHADARPFLCDDCGSRFKQRWCLARHRKSCCYDNRNLHECNECHLRFSTNTGLRHHKKFHDPARPYQCKICGLRFSYKGVYRTHTLHKHSEERSHECEKCSKAFKTMALLKQHQSAHDNVRKFHCVSCGANYKSAASLRKHRNNKHPDLQCKTRSTNTAGAVISQSPMAIDQPSTSGACSNDLVIEERLNKLFDASNRTFPDYGESERSDRSCIDNPSTFKTRALLKQHQSAHDNVRKFHCGSCSASYKSAASLKRHRNNKHPDLQCKTRSTNTADAVISQSPMAIDQPSTSDACSNDLVIEERLNKLFDASNRTLPDYGEPERSDRSCIDDPSASASASASGAGAGAGAGAVIDIDETNKHKKQETTGDSTGKGKHGMSESLEEQTVNNGVVVGQSPSVIDQPSTSATNIDLMAEEDLDNVFDSYLNDLCLADWPSDRLNAFGIDNSFDPGVDQITVDSHGKHEQGMSESLEKQTVNVGALVSQSRSVMDDWISEEGFDDLIHRYARDLLDDNDRLFNESGEPCNDIPSDQSYPANRQADTLTHAEKITGKKH